MENASPLPADVNRTVIDSFEALGLAAADELPRLSRRAVAAVRACGTEGLSVFVRKLPPEKLAQPVMILPLIRAFEVLDQAAPAGAQCDARDTIRAILNESHLTFRELALQSLNAARPVRAATLSARADRSYRRAAIGEVRNVKEEEATRPPCEDAACVSAAASVVRAPIASVPVSKPAPTPRGKGIGLPVQTVATMLTIGSLFVAAAVFWGSLNAPADPTRPSATHAALPYTPR